ncbi:5'-nucleotidase, lipoprotein e(P4) family [Mangrovicella endophytica]|uniref:5'-nucleotidase, lipoprotein e(P4) family n=1 Tax=Mangrovicella endophytica TaxID=2066697 RepID=UPI0018E47CE1|nr:5'-nucleotidase, lipoprotein e(P4) family [Mangrovicella endophytica]
MQPKIVVFAIMAAVTPATCVLAQEPAAEVAPAAAAAVPDAAARASPNDLLNAALWMQSSVEYKATAIGIYALARSKLDAAIADKAASALDQNGAAELPPAIILDLDETVLDNAAYESGLVTSNHDYSSKTWGQWVDAKAAKAVPGALDYLTYADSKGVKIFYVTNRNANQEEATRANMQALGFPMGGNVDTFLMSREKGWRSAKKTRRDFVAKDYRVVALVGDNFNDFSDAASGTPAERLSAFDGVKAHFGTDWFMLPNPTYGSFESAPYGNDFRLPAEKKRQAKIEALEPWVPTGE